MKDLVPFEEGGNVDRPREPARGGLGEPAHGGLNGRMDPHLERLDLREVFGVLRRNWHIIAAITVATLAVGAFLVLRQPAEYRATNVLRLQDERGAMTTGIQDAAVQQLTGKTEDPLLSQIQVLRSRRVAEPVVTALGLRLVPENEPRGAIPITDVEIADPDLTDTLEVSFEPDRYVVRGGEGEAAAGYGAPVHVGGVRFAVAHRPEPDEVELTVLSRQAAVDRLFERFRTSPRENTDVVDASYTSTDPRLAAAVANAMVDEFQAQSARTEQEQARRRRIFVEEQLAVTDSQLVLAQGALTRFREEEQLFSSREMLAAQQTGIMELQVRREELAVDRGIFTALLERLRTSEDQEQGLSSLVSAPGIADNPVIGQLYEQLVRYESALDSLTMGDWGSAPTNPDVQRLRSLASSTRDKLTSAVASHLSALDARIAAMDDLRRRNEAELATLPPTEAREARLVQHLESIRKVADQLREEYQKARIAEAIEAGHVEVIDRAAVPLEPIGAARGLQLALALVLGLMLGTGVAFLKEHLNDSLQRKEEIEQILRIPGLAVIPQILTPNGTRPVLPRFGANRATGVSPPSSLVAVTDPRSGSAEAYRSLRTNLIFSQAVQSFRRIVITSSQPGEGKTTTAANLAITFAQQGMRVLLMDCDLRRPQIHAVFNLPKEPGLTNLLVGAATLEEVIRATAVDGLDASTSGPLPPNPLELLGGPAMRKVLQEVGEIYDLVLIDTAPLLAASDAAVLGTEADGVLMVVRAGDTDRGAAQAALAQLHNVNARVIGAVLNDPDAKVPRYDGNYQYAYYGEQS